LKKKKARIGDIAEIVAPAGLAYVQYSHDGCGMGQLVRVLPGLHDIRPDDFAELARQKELYFVFYTLEYALRAGQTQIVSNQPVPKWAVPAPLMRHPGLRDVNDGRVVNWRIDPAMASPTIDWIRNTPPVYELSPELRRMSICMLVSHPAMVKDVAQGWTPERNEELEEEARQRARLSGANQAMYPHPENQRMQHYLYFAKREDAQKAAEWLRKRSFSVETNLAPDGESWLTLGKHSPPDSKDMEALRDKLEALADKLHGEYDGWELRVSD
jgi:hypothetical protein